MTEQEISPFKALDFIRDNAKKYALAKANVVYMTEYRKTQKALLMNESTAKTEGKPMSKADARKLKPGDNVRLKASGAVVVVKGREDSGRIVCGYLNGRGDPVSLRADEIRAEVRGM